MSRLPLPTLTPAEAPPLGEPVPPRVVRVPRRGAVLHDTPLGGPDVPGLNVTRSCAFSCAFCSVRAAPSYPRDGVVLLLAGTASALSQELAAGPRPRAVFVSPATDPFPPLAEVQEEVARVVRVLARAGVEAWLMTRGRILPDILAALLPARESVRITVPLTTLWDGTQALLEPGTPSPESRLEQLARLHGLGFRVQAALDPLVPGLTDSTENLAGVLAALAGVGVRSVTTSYLFLREGIAAQLRQQLGARAAEVLRAFEKGPVLTANGLAPARYLPRARRQRGYATVMSLAANHGISVSVSALTNPDFTPTKREEGPKRSLRAMYMQAVEAQGR